MPVELLAHRTRTGQLEWTFAIATATCVPGPGVTQSWRPGSPRSQFYRWLWRSASGRHHGLDWTKVLGATVADRKPLTERIHVPLMRPLLGNKGVHYINGNVNNLGSTLNEKNTRISTRKPPTYVHVRLGENHWNLTNMESSVMVVIAGSLWAHWRCIHMSEAEYDQGFDSFNII